MRSRLYMSIVIPVSDPYSHDSNSSDRPTDAQTRTHLKIFTKILGYIRPETPLYLILRVFAVFGRGRISTSGEDFLKILRESQIVVGVTAMNV